jgi:hypothetical protein
MPTLKMTEISNKLPNDVPQDLRKTRTSETLKLVNGKT